MTIVSGLGKVFCVWQPPLRNFGIDFSEHFPLNAQLALRRAPIWMNCTSGRWSSMLCWVQVMIAGQLVITTDANVSSTPQRCSVCRDGADITLPEQQIRIPDFDFLQTCQDLNDTIPLLLLEEDEACQQLQSLGSLCGCPRTETDTCNLCGDSNELVGSPNKEIPLFPDLFPAGIVPTCDLFQAYLHSLPTNDEEGLCGMSQAFLSSYCDCPSQAEEPTNTGTDTTPCSLCPDGNKSTTPDAPTYLGFQGFETCRELELAAAVLFTSDHEFCEPLQSISPLCGCGIQEDHCTMCTDGSEVPYPDKVMPFLDGAAFFGSAGSSLELDVTCGLYEGYLKSLSKDDEMCPMAQSMSTYCGCPARENHCEFCKNGERVPEDHYDVILNSLARGFEEEGGEAAQGIHATCEFAEALTFQLPADNEVCRIRELSWICGCNNGKSSYGGLDTERKKFLVYIFPIITASLSLIGSFTVAFDVLSSEQRRKQTYCQLVLGVVAFDLITASGFVVSATPVPTMIDGDPLGMYGARGTMLTCKIQAVMIHLGYGTVFYNVALCFYYFLIVVRGWKEARLKKIVPWMHGISITFAIIFSLAGLRYYGPGIYSCALVSFPWNERKWPFSLIVAVPTFSGKSAGRGRIIFFCFSVSETDSSSSCSVCVSRCRGNGLFAWSSVLASSC